MFTKYIVGPVIFTTPLSVNVSASDALSLNCVATGFPVPTITWFLNGKEVRFCMPIKCLL